MYKKVAVYDFDGTLCDSPLPEEGKLIWKEKTGNDYPYQGWWGRPETLSTDVFDIKLFDSVVNRLKSDYSKNDTYTIILTSRIGRIKPAIRNILNMNNIKVDGLFLKNGSKEKNERLEDIISSLPNPNQIEQVDIYDDREKEFIVFGKFRDENPQYKVNIYKVVNGNISPLVSSEDVPLSEQTLKKISKLISDEIDSKIVQELKNKKYRI